MTAPDHEDSGLIESQIHRMRNLLAYASHEEICEILAKKGFSPSEVWLLIKASEVLDSPPRCC